MIDSAQRWELLAATIVGQFEGSMPKGPSTH
jgi:hypothetical protein